MAEVILDNTFKSEMLEFKTAVMRFIDVANHKFDGLAEGLRTNTFKLERVDTRLGRVEEKVERLDETVDRLEVKFDRVEATLSALASDVTVLSNQFSHVGVEVVKDSKRIDSLEDRVGELESGVH